MALENSQNTITNLPRHPDSQARIDHSFQSPTFKRAIQGEVDFYLENGRIR